MQANYHEGRTILAMKNLHTIYGHAVTTSHNFGLQKNNDRQIRYMVCTKLQHTA